ncbi:MAG: site-2 protease family protein [Clostridiaceae bacterium]|nr:site-2 protease family protein [Clostridiaceae bacterium]
MLSNNSISDILLNIPALLLALTFHELSHGIVAYALGDNTAKRQGRLSLNPLKHIDWLGFIMLITVGFGWAKPVPVDPSYFKDPKKGMAITSIAGPLSNVILAFITALLVSWAGLIYMQDGSLYFSSEKFYNVFLIKFFIYNCAFAMFNLLPIPPLDGSKIVGAFLPNRIYFKYMQYERYGIIVMIVLLYTGILTPILSNGVENLMNAIFNGVSFIIK